MMPSASAQRAGRSMAPLLAGVLLRRPLVKPLALLENYLAFIQGKGSGGGWDIGAEAQIASLHIRRSDAIVFDVGAHHGEWSRELLNLLGPASLCSVFQFEPLKHNQSILRSLNLPRTNIVEAAVSDKPGKATLWVLDTASPTALHDPLPAWSHVPSLHRRREAQLEKYDMIEELVEVVTIDKM